MIVAKYANTTKIGPVGSMQSIWLWKINAIHIEFGFTYCQGYNQYNRNN